MIIRHFFCKCLDGFLFGSLFLHNGLTDGFLQVLAYQCCALCSVRSGCRLCIQGTRFIEVVSLSIDFMPACRQLSGFRHVFVIFCPAGSHFHGHDCTCHRQHCGSAKDACYFCTVVFKKIHNILQFLSYI